MREFCVSKIRKLLEAHHSLTRPANRLCLAPWAGALPGNRRAVMPYLVGKLGLLGGELPHQTLLNSMPDQDVERDGSLGHRQLVSFPHH